MTRHEAFAPDRILVPTDFEAPARAALETAVGLAQGAASQLRLLHVFPLAMSYGAPYLPPPLTPDSPLYARLMADVKRFAEPAVAAGLATRGLVREGDPATEIVRELEATSTDLVVMGRHGRGTLDRWLVGSVTERVLRRSPRPVLVVSTPPATPLRGGVRRVLCAVELAKASRGTLAYAASVAAALGAELTLLHVVEEPEGELWVRSGLEIPEFSRLMQADARKRLQQLTEERGLRSVEPLVAKGKPYHQILKAVAESEADLVVMGSHAGATFDRLFLGTTVRHVIREATVPVLVLPARVALEEMGQEEERLVHHA